METQQTATSHKHTHVTSVGQYVLYSRRANALTCGVLLLQGVAQACEIQPYCEASLIPGPLPHMLNYVLIPVCEAETDNEPTQIHTFCPSSWLTSVVFPAFGTPRMAARSTLWSSARGSPCNVGSVDALSTTTSVSVNTDVLHSEAVYVWHGREDKFEGTEI